MILDCEYGVSSNITASSKYMIYMYGRKLNLLYYAPYLRIMYVLCTYNFHYFFSLMKIDVLFFRMLHKQEQK